MLDTVMALHTIHVHTLMYMSRYKIDLIFFKTFFKVANVMYYNATELPIFQEVNFQILII